MENAQTAVAHEAARALRDSAVRHKRAAGFHRRAAQKDMEALSKLDAACKALGIGLSEGAQGGNHG